MNDHMLRWIATWPLLLILSIGLFAPPASAQSQAESLDMIVNADQGEITISRHIYGHFAEHLGEDIYGGFWIQDDQGNWQYNQQVIDALKDLQ